MIRISTDTSNIRATMRALRENAPAATEDAVVIMAASVLRKTGLQSSTMFQHGTRRFARGWLMAYNALLSGRSHLSEYGMAPLGLPRLRHSELVDRAYQSLRTRAERSAARLRELRALRAEIAGSAGFAGNARGIAARRSSLSRLDKEIHRIGEFQLRADNEVQKFEMAMRAPGALVMFGKTTKREFGLSNIERIFPNEFGATARVIRTGVRVTVEIEHHEPHARIVEGRRQLFTRNLADLRSETGNFVVTGRPTDAFLNRISRGVAPGTVIVRSTQGRLVAKRRIA